MELVIDDIQLKRATAAAWVALNPVLLPGEPGVETDTRKMKIGDGATAWNSLRYSVATADSLIVGNSTPTLSTNYDMSFSLDNNTTLRVQVRGSDGVTRSTTLSLS